MTFGMQLTFVP